MIFVTKEKSPELRGRRFPSPSFFEGGKTLVTPQQLSKTRGGQILLERWVICPLVSPAHTAGSHGRYIRVWPFPSSLENIQMFRPEETEKGRLEEEVDTEIARGGYQSDMLDPGWGL